jgi:tetratricopeptide (TPR) repeat protein
MPMTPGVAATPAPPPLDYANVPPSMPVSDSSLDPLIQKTTEPALGTSLRITEEARRQLAAGHPDEAIRTLGRAVSVDAGNPYAYFYLGRSYFMKKDYNQALTFLARAEIGMGSDSAWLGETLSFEGACYEELGRNREAADAYQRAIQVAPGNLMARVGYGRLAPELPPPSPAAEPSQDIGALDAPPPIEATPQSVPTDPVPAPEPEDSTDD